MSRKTQPNKIAPWYDIIPKSLLLNTENPHYNKHMISVPFRICLVGCSGAGKSTLILDLIHKMPDTFTKIVLLCQDASEPLYQYLQSRFKPNEELEVHEGIENVPNISTFDHGKGFHTLVICDDLVLEKDQKKLKEYFLRGRKIPISIIYATQSYFSTPTFIRKNLTHCFMKKLSTIRDLKWVLKDYDLDSNPESMLEMYKYCVDDGGFLNLAVTDKSENRYRKNYTEILNPSDFS
jgi:ABC-type dipeptide/oligopeptide/nickel transport system ATPase component